MHGGHTNRQQLALQIQIEVWRIHTNKNRRGVGPQTIKKLSANGHNASVVTQHFDVATHGQALVRPPSLKVLLDHSGSTNTLGLGLGPSVAHTFEQQAGQHVP